MTDDPNLHHDPHPPALREGDHFLLHFADNRQIFAQALPQWKCARTFAPCKINRRAYGTHHLIGLPYGTVLEVGRERLIPLPEGEDLLPGAPEEAIEAAAAASSRRGSAEDGAAQSIASAGDGKGDNGNKVEVSRNDNRNLVDDNTSQKLTYESVAELMNDASTPGAAIVSALISHSSSFGTKTAFSQAKYVKRKQLKYQPRCRIVRITPATLCAAMHLRDARRISNMREDTLGQILSSANVCAGQRVMVADGAVMGLATAGCVRRMGGYGTLISLYAGVQQPGYLDVVNRMNLTVSERQCLKYVSVGEVFADADAKARQMEALRDANGDVLDVERREREKIPWPTTLQPHTRDYLLNDLKEEHKIDHFLAKRSQRFTRKLTRPTTLELRALVDGCRDPEEELDVGAEGKRPASTTEETDATTNASQGGTLPRQCDSLIVAVKYDPTATLLRLLPYLAPSCPFVVYHEFMEPLLETFRTLQNYYDDHKDDDNDGDADTANSESAKPPKPMMLRRNIAINLRLTDTWFREYQVLEGRTHPNMTMSQNGGYILMGTKLCPRTGTNELDEATLKEIRARVGGRRTQHKKKSKEGGGGGGKKKEKKTKRKRKDGEGGEKAAKR